jgi:hypothetical protein
MSFKYRKEKPNELIDKLQLFSEDIDGNYNKRFFDEDYEELYNKIKKRKVNNIYEDNRFNNLIRLHFDIDNKENYIHEVYKRKCVDKILEDLIPEIEKKINMENIKSIVWLSNGLNKLSFHIIFPEIYFRSIKEMKYFVSELKYIDKEIYNRRGCFRLPLCTKFNKNNKLEYYKSYNYKVIDEKQLFLDSCITNVNIEKQIILTANMPENMNINNYTIKNKNYYYLGVELQTYLKNISDALDQIDITGYSLWLHVTSSIKDLYDNIRESDENKELIYLLYDIKCRKYSNYDQIKNRCIFNKLESFLDINYIFYLSGIKAFIPQIYDIKNIMFNPNKYDDKIICKQEKYIKLDENIVIEYDTIFMKSPPGTGKTHIMKLLCKKNNKSEIMSITSRVNLAGEHMIDLELDFYKKTNISKSKKLAIQLESLYKCNLNNFNDYILILDEINSLLTHLRSPTMANNRSLNFTCLIELIKKANTVICLDADMCDWNIDFINKVRGDNYIVYYNYYPNKANVPAIFYNCEFKMINIMKKLVGKKYFVACFDSLRYMKKVIQELINKTNIKIDEILIYSSEEDYGIINTKNWKNKYIFYTPSILYGVSFDDVLCDVFCFIKKSHLHALHIYQMSSRTRKIKTLHMYCKLQWKYNKYKSIEYVKEEYNMFESKFIDNANITINLTNDEKDLYQLMYFNNIFLESILKTNTFYYLYYILCNLGFKISFNRSYSKKIYFPIIHKQKRDIKDNILTLFNLNVDELTEFQQELFESNTLLEKHFNLRTYFKNLAEQKNEDFISRSLFTESLKNRYMKIKLLKEYMSELGFNSIEDIKYVKQNDVLCNMCIQSINNPIDCSKNKIRWCKKLVYKLDDNDLVNKKIYNNIINGKVKICRNCKYLIEKNIIITNMLEKNSCIIDRFDQVVKSKWINKNLDYIYKLFNIRSELNKDYYSLYLLMITLIKHLFGSVLEQDRIRNNETKYYVYNIKNDILKNHKDLFDILDNNNYVEKNRDNFYGFAEDSEEEDDK